MLNSPSVVDGRDFGFVEDDDASQDNGDWQGMFTQADPWSTLRLPSGFHLIAEGAGGNGIDSSGSIMVRKPLTVDLGGCRILWTPTTPSDRLLTVSDVGLGYAAGLTNEETRLFGFNILNARVFGDRVTRANAFRIYQCDYLNMQNCFVYGVKGTALEIERTREFNIDGLYTRYNAYLDPVNFHLSNPDVIIATDYWNVGLTGDTNNLNHLDNCKFVYPLGPGLVIDNAQYIEFGKTMVHGLQEGVTSFEANFLNYFPGTAGFTADVANNELAALHTGSGTLANVNGLNFIPAMRKCRQIHISGGTSTPATVDIERLTINGSFSDSSVHLINAELRLGAATGGGAQSATTWHTSQTFTADATTNLLTMDTATPYLMTGDVVRLTVSGGALPAPLVAYGSSNTVNNSYIVRCTNATTNTIYSLHTSYRDAINNLSIIDLTTAGSGTMTLLHEHGDAYQLDNGSRLFLDGKTTIINDRWHVNDDYTSLVIGNYISSAPASASDIGRAFGNVVVLASLKANMQLTTDQQFNRIYAGDRIYWTSLVAVCATGDATDAVGGLYTAASKSGAIAFLPATFVWDNLNAPNDVLEWARYNDVGTPAVAVTQSSTRSTTVVCDALRGVITTDTTSLAAGADASFTVTNSTVAEGDVVVLNQRSDGTPNTSFFSVFDVTDGSFRIRAHNLSGATADILASVLDFHVDKKGPLLTNASAFFTPWYLSLTTGSTAACTVDFYMLGIPANHP